MDRSGQILLGKYQLTRMLGKGGMGEVWEGEHKLTGRRVAVKMLSDAYLSNKKVVARFGREARAASSVQHDGIVEILDQDSDDDGVPFLVMEFLEGESVGQRIKRKTRLSESEALALMSPLLDALNAAHQAGVIHRDLKPDNVFILPGVRGEERIKILDFGISQKADEIEHRLTQEGSVLGTPHYMSPEQARGEANIDVRVDVYAAAVMLYECVVGEVPFDAGNYNALLQIIISRPPVPPRARGAELSAPVEQAVMAALSKKREERPPNARVFRELLLEAALQDERSRLDLRSWKFMSLPANDIAPSLRPVAREFKLETGPFSGPPARGNFQIPRDSRHIEGVPFSNHVKAPPSGAARRASLATPVTGSAAPDLRITTRPASAPEASPRITLTGSPALELEVVTKPQASLRAQPRAHKISRPLRPLSGAKPAEKRSVAGAIVGWIAAACALAALIYVASAVFKRPDPRKLSPKTPASAPAQGSAETR